MAVKICPGCGEGNLESAHVCVICGSSLSEVAPQGTLNSDKKYNGSLKGTRKKSAFCSHCHEGLEEGAMKCRYCGTLVSRTTPAHSYSHYVEGYT